MGYWRPSEQLRSIVKVFPLRGPAAAVEAAIALEEIATIAWRTLGIDPSSPAIQAELLHRHFDRKHGAGAYYGQPPRAEVGG